MKEQISLLIELQKAESDVNKINVKFRSLPEEIAKVEESFQTIQNRFEEQKRKFEEAQKAHREQEDKLKKNQELVRRAKDRLSEVKTNKEYQAVLKEIETLESKNSDIEDEIISLLEEVDTVKTTLTVKEKEMEACRLDYNREKETLEAALKSLDKALAESSSKSSELRNKIAGNFLKQYEAIKALHKSVAVTAVWKEVCQGCHMNIPPQLYNELQRSNDLLLCPNCNRIIYWQDQNGEKS